MELPECATLPLPLSALPLAHKFCQLGEDKHIFRLLKHLDPSHGSFWVSQLVWRNMYIGSSFWEELCFCLWGDSCPINNYTNLVRNNCNSKTQNGWGLSCLPEIHHGLPTISSPVLLTSGKTLWWVCMATSSKHRDRTRASTLCYFILFFSSFEHVKSLLIMGPNYTKNSSLKCDFLIINYQ